MSVKTNKLLKQDLMTIKNHIDWCDVELVDGNIRKWKVLIFGPPDTGYENGTFHVDLDFSGFYDSPGIDMKTKIYHMNINFGGKICLEIVEDDDFDVRKQGAFGILQEIYDLMKKPEPELSPCAFTNWLSLDSSTLIPLVTILTTPFFPSNLSFINN